MIKTQALITTCKSTQSRLSREEANDVDVKDGRPEMVAPPWIPSMNETIESRIKRWLVNMGLENNPFQHLEAGADWNIPYYLIDHQQFDQLLVDQPGFVFAPPGGGKTAFRVRLARECRASSPEHPVFPIVHKAPPPKKFSAEASGVEYPVDKIARSAAQELLLYLAFHPTRFKDYEESTRIEIREILEWNLTQPLRHYLARLEREGSVRSLIEAFDRSYASTPNPPRKEDLLELCKQLSAVSLSKRERPEAAQRFQEITDLLYNVLGFRSIYLLIDGVDGYFETANNPEQAVSLIDPLLKQTLDLAKKRIYCKYFLPTDLRPILVKKYPKLLTSTKNIAKIDWDAETLIAVVQQRLREASGNRFNSLRAISNRELRGADEAPEATIVKRVIQKGKPGPREVIQVVLRLFQIHIESDLSADIKLTPRDLQAALDWYNKRA